ncbi:MAG TPA: glycosyltransferase family 4 protein [Candidatus Acidoferrum sp.]|nr:glycosyltransferase family 4 protein [Candidatus Acidoferrum sp.]
MCLKFYGDLPITLWMNMPSHHQDDLICSLDETPGVDLHVVYDSPMAGYRQKLGWQAAPREYRHTFLSGCKPLDAVRTVKASRDRIHIFNGIWAVPAFAAALTANLAQGGAPFFVYSEAPNRGLKRGVLRRGLRDAFGRFVARSARGRVLAVSRIAGAFYRGLGFPDGRIYPFGYFRDARPKSAAELALGSTGQRPVVTGVARGLRVVFVGTLWEAKGIDLLLGAFEPLWRELPGLSLDLIGDGPLLPQLNQYLEDYPEARIRLRGVIPSDRIPRELAAYDLLVLPSRGDGWGMVVNEALAAGLPAIVSDVCGAADLIRDGANGYVIPSGDAVELRRAIRRYAETSRAEREAMSVTAAATGEALRPQVAARYLVDCVRHSLGDSPRPSAPWCVVGLPADAALAAKGERRPGGLRHHQI